MIIHAFGVDKCVVVVKLRCFYDFSENELRMENVEFYEFEWIDDVVMLR